MHQRQLSQILPQLQCELLSKQPALLGALLTLSGKHCIHGARLLSQSNLLLLYNWEQHCTSIPYRSLHKLRLFFLHPKLLLCQLLLQEPLPSLPPPPLLLLRLCMADGRPEHSVTARLGTAPASVFTQLHSSSPPSLIISVGH